MTTPTTPQGHDPNKRRLLVIVLFVFLITVLHYSTTVYASYYHDIYRRLYYIPIVLGGLWFGLRGGLGTALAVSLIYAPHVLFQWRSHTALPLEQYLEMVLYNCIGILTGTLSQRERAQRVRYQQAANDLQESYTKLKEQADIILETEEQLHHATRLAVLGELAAGLAHEVRNPLASIRLSTEHLADHHDLSSKDREYLDILLTEVNRLDQVVEEYLDLARPKAASRKIFNPNQALSEVVQLLRQPARKNAVAIRLDTGEIPEVSGEPVQLKQAFLNLGLNAIQAMADKGGTLTITSSVFDGRVAITFTDSGPGISADDLSRVFEPFFTTRRQGSGLGLAITRRIVTSHHGEIKANSQLGSGATFTIYLPVKEKTYAA